MEPTWYCRIGSVLYIVPSSWVARGLICPHCQDAEEIISVLRAGHVTEAEFIGSHGSVIVFGEVD